MNEYWALVSQVGVWGWVVTVFFFIHFSFPGRDQFVFKSAAKWGGISMVFFLVWIAGMLLA